MKQNSFVKQPCERCGSKKRISKTWKEKIPTLSGVTEVEYSQIICTNIVCQTEFDENLEKERKKRESLRLHKEITAYEAIHYIAAQLFAGIVAAGVYFFIQNKLFIPAAGEHVHIFSALVVEILFTFLLASVVLHVAATEKTKGNNYFGLAIG